MANMRVHELAKKLNISSKEIIETLNSDTKTYKTMSGLGDAEIARVQNKFHKSAPSASAPKTDNRPAGNDRMAKPAQSAPQSHDNAANRTDNRNENRTDNRSDEKKAHISQVYFPQNSSNRGHQNQNNNNNNHGSNNERHNNNGYQGNNNRNENGYQGNRNRNDRQGSYNNNYRNNNGERNNDRQGGYNNNYRNNNNGENGERNNDRQGGYNNNYRNNYNNNNNNGERNNDRQGGYNNNYRNNNGERNNDRQGGYNNNYRNNNNGENGERNNERQGGYNNNYRSNYNNNGNSSNGGQGGYRGNNNGGQGGYRGNNNNGGQGGYRGNNNNGGQGGYRGNNNGGQGGYNNNGQGRRNDRRDSAPKEEFVIQTKPDARKPESRNNYKKNNDKKRTESRENLRFAKDLKRPTKQVEKVEDTIKQLVLPDELTIKELADKMKIQPSVVVKKLFLQGKVVTINQDIDYDTAEEIALEFNCICEHEVKVDVIAELLKEEEDTDPEDTLVARPPVVCVMGHVDHGKTSLLDAIRETHVTDKESGGITQKIGAYTVNVNGKDAITFLDTPGHEAFTAMRMRGAQATDIAILVVAADDGVMPQTIEAINHAKAADVEIIVAVNKIDKPNANVDKVKQELTEYGLIAEDWGGSTIFCPVSAHTKEGIDNLLDMILLTAEVQELKANPNRKARGIVIEAELDKGRGPVATILVQKGTLKVGDSIAAGACHGKIRAMIDDKGRRVKTAGPSTPVEILGLNDVPNAGEIIVAMDTEKEARSFAETFISEGRKKLLDDTKHKLSMDTLFDQIKAGNLKELALIVKADVQGSVEAVKSSLEKLSNEEVVVKIIHGGVGNINESDVVLASASNAIIIGFNVKPDNQARIVAEHEKVDLRLYTVIYNAIEDVEAALKGMLEPIYEEKVIGHAEILQIFKASGIGNIAGAIVKDGKITNSSSVRIKREDTQTYEGPIATLKRFKDEVKEVKAGFECGLVFEKFNDIKEGDVVEAYEMVEVPR